MKIGVCGIACERCPRMVAGKCPSGLAGCVPRDNPYCKVAACAYRRSVRLCFECPEFPCETTKSGPISHSFCMYISGRED